MAIPPPDFAIDADLVRSLLRDAAAEFADLPLGDRFEGWDNVTYRLGYGHAVRLPRLHGSAPLAEIEQRWLAHIAALLPVAVPVPVASVGTSEAFPAPWTVVTWIDGDDGGAAPLADAAVEDLGAALAALHVLAPADAPVCPWRATPLGARRDDVEQRVAQLGAAIDAVSARALFEAGAAVDVPGDRWIHADLHALNVVTRGSRLAGILDWGEVSRGTPLIDVAQVWVMLGGERWEEFTRGYGRDLRAEDPVRFAGHAVDAATRLALSSHAARNVPARRALVELGVAP